MYDLSRPSTKRSTSLLARSWTDAIKITKRSGVVVRNNKYSLVDITKCNSEHLSYPCFDEKGRTRTQRRASIGMLGQQYYNLIVYIDILSLRLALGSLVSDVFQIYFLLSI